MAYVLKVTKSLANNIYTVILTAESVSQADLDLMTEYGEPIIDIGGSFTGPPIFTLASKEKKIRTGFPVIQQFDGNADDDAEDKANAWTSENKAKILSALVTLRANVNAFSSEVTDEL